MGNRKTIKRQEERRYARLRREELKVTDLDFNSFVKKLAPNAVFAMSTTAVTQSADPPTEETNEMGTVEVAKDFGTERRALVQAVANAQYAKARELEKKFYITDERPLHPKDAVERIKAGKFVYSNAKTAEDEEEWEWGGNPVYGIRFRDPDKQPDKKGYREAERKLIKEAAAVELEIRVLDPKDALEKVRAFERQTFH